MEIILKSKNIKNLPNTSFLFGLKNLSTYDNTVTLEELEKLNNKNIYIAIDKNLMNEDLEALEKALIKLNELNIKGIFFYDLAVLHLSKKLNIKTPLIWNQNFLVTNYKTCNFYHKEGAHGAVLSSEITIDEIKEIAKNTDINIFVNIFGYELMAVSKRNLITNYFKYINEENDKNINYMSENGQNYPIIENETCTKIYTKDVLCGIRYLNILKDIGIDYIILNEDLLNEEDFLKVYEIFNKAVTNNLSDKKLLELEKKINKQVPTSLGFFNKETIYKVKKND